MIDTGYAKRLLSTLPSTFVYADGVTATISNGHYVYALPEPVTADVIEQTTGRPATMFIRCVTLDRLTELGVIDWDTGNVLLDAVPSPCGWLNDVWIGCCRSTEQDTGKLDVKPWLLWLLWCDDKAGVGMTVKSITHAAHCNERQARRYMAKLRVFDRAIETYITKHA